MTLARGGLALGILLAACAPRADDARATTPLVASGSEPRTCASDLVCPLGSVCAKRAGAFTGECLRSVDADGRPVEVRHSAESYGAGPLTCNADADCPTRFRCDVGRCIH